MGIEGSLLQFNFQVHLLIDCVSMGTYRRSCEIASFIEIYRRIQPTLSSIKLFAMFLDDRNPEVLKRRAVSLYTMLLGWHKLMNIEM